MKRPLLIVATVLAIGGVVTVGVVGVRSSTAPHANSPTSAVAADGSQTTTPNVSSSASPADPAQIPGSTASGTKPAAGNMKTLVAALERNMHNASAQQAAARAAEAASSSAPTSAAATGAATGEAPGLETPPAAEAPVETPAAAGIPHTDLPANPWRPIPRPSKRPAKPEPQPTTQNRPDTTSG